MNKLSSIAKGLDVFLKVIYYFCIVAGGILLAGIIFFLVRGKADVIENMSTSLKLGPAQLELAQGVVVSENYMFASAIGTVVAALVIISYIILMIIIFRNILQPMKEAKPFNGVVSKQLRKLGWFILIGGAIAQVARVVAEMLFVMPFDLQQLFASDKVISCNMKFIMDADFILVAIVVFLLAFIFRYGEELQKQDDELL